MAYPPSLFEMLGVESNFGCFAVFKIGIDAWGLSMGSFQFDVMFFR